MTTHHVVLRTRAAALVLLAIAQPLAHVSAQPDARISTKNPSSDTAASVRWNAITLRLIGRASSTRMAPGRASAGQAVQAAQLGGVRMRDRVGPIVSLSGYLAADTAAHDPSKPSMTAAIATSAATVLRLYLPELSGDIDKEVERALDGERRAGASAQRIDGGSRLGRFIAARTIERTKAERADTPWTGTVPNGPGKWWSAPGVEPGLTFRFNDPLLALKSMEQVRPAPPPAFGSTTFVAALDEVRRVARDRTPEETRIAQRWGLEAAVDSWARIIDELLARHRVDDPRAAHLLALVGVATNDAGIACTEAKYHYSFIRPSQADSTIPLAERLTLPNFPSYPSGHACLSGAIAETVAAFLPEVRAEVTRLADEAAMSRLYAGVHFRFDNDAGLELGRQVARYVIAEDRAGRLVSRWR